MTPGQGATGRTTCPGTVVAGCTGVVAFPQAAVVAAAAAVAGAGAVPAPGVVDAPGSGAAAPAAAVPPGGGGNNGIADEVAGTALGPRAMGAEA
mmetsp:Transcript_87776/g.183479  ORF Transcript_87776/g.183479 Transcript_87776/m.183479 type:complete len:94 (-) Transcript_87776:774-1055(-)